MQPRLSVLASGSGGNASLLEMDGFGLLIDVGLGPRQIAGRLARIGASWKSVHAVLLTHTHSDHWKPRTLSHLLNLQVPLYCHSEHQRELRSWCDTFTALQSNRLIRLFEPDEELRFPSGLRCLPFAVRHDGGPTFGFRFERSADLFGSGWSMAYASDLGCWDADLVPQMCDVDLLALEFNHDIELQLLSGRSRWLIARVLGDEGHLSNEQAADLLGEVLRNSQPGRLRQVVQLHLSRECNRPELAVEAAQIIVSEIDADADVEIHTACQDSPTVIPTPALRSA